jgi:hypothetical protein
VTDIRVKDNYGDAILADRVRRFIESVPGWATGGLKEVVIVDPRRSSMWGFEDGVIGQYVENLKEIWIVGGDRYGMEGVESVIGHEIGHHVYRSVLSNEQRKRIPDSMDPSREGGYSVHQYGEEDFSDAFCFCPLA